MLLHLRKRICMGVVQRHPHDCFLLYLYNSNMKLDLPINLFEIWEVFVLTPLQASVTHSYTYNSSLCRSEDALEMFVYLRRDIIHGKHVKQ